MASYKHLLPPALFDLHELKTRGVKKLCLQALATGALSGLIIGLFRIAYTKSTTALALLYEAHKGTSLCTLATAAIILCFALIAWLMVRHEPLISGSGIPHVELVLQGKLPMPWFRILWTKFIGTLASLAGGLAVGREGPCIQMGATLACGVGALWHDGIRPRFLIGGSTAGMTAAFGAPLAGLLFAFEEMRTLPVPHIALFTGLAACGAWLTTDYLLALGLVFPLSDARLPLSQLWLVPLAGLLTGLLAILYNKMLVGLILFEDQLKIQQPSRILFAFSLAFLLTLVYPSAVPSLGPSVESLAQGLLPLSFLFFLWIVRLLFNCFSFASGVSGGILMPMLFAGSLTGALLYAILHSFALADGCAQASLIFCTAGLFAGTVRAPLTGAFLITEMTGAWQLLPALIILSCISSFIATRCGSAPVYDSLRARQLRNYLQQQEQVRS